MPAARLLRGAVHSIGPLLASSFAFALGSSHVNDVSIAIGANVQISAAKPSTMHGEGQIATDPTDANRVIACSMFRSEEIGQGVAVYESHDGGIRWDNTFETPTDSPAGDPACAFDADGAAYLTMIPMRLPSQAIIRLPLLRSDDHARTWRPVGALGYLDRESLVIDRTSGRFHNRIYAHGAATIHGTNGLSREAIELYTSSDGGRTFGRPATRVALGRGYVFGVGNSVVMRDGRWISVFGELKTYWENSESDVASPGGFLSPAPEPESAWLRAISSDDGGDSLNLPITIAGWHMPNPYVRHSLPIPSIAVDETSGPFSDRLYVVWPDTRSGGTDILCSYSADRGRTWSPPITINDERRPMSTAAAPNHLLPAVAVNAAGAVAVSWLDRRDEPDNLGWRARVRVSIDGGETFLPSAIVSEAPARFDGSERWPAIATTSGGGAPLSGGGLLRVLIFAPPHLYAPGDYAGIAADRDGIFHPYWIDNRSGWHQAWTATLKVAGRAIRNGSADLAALDDVTAFTTLVRIASRYDRSAQIAGVTIRIENTSEHRIEGPLTIRLITLDSDVAAVEAIGATNGVTGAGAAFDVPQIEGRVLEPGSSTQAITLTFTLRDVRPFLQGHVDRSDNRLVNFTARVLGRLAK